MRTSIMSALKAFGAMLFLLVFGMNTNAYAQYYQARVNAMGVVTFSSSFSSIVGTGETQVFGSNFDDGCVGVNLPFAFNYDNTAFASGSTLGISSNGIIYFGFLNSSYGNFLGSSNYAPAICPYSADLYTATGKIVYIVTGTAPFRTLTIEYNNFAACCSSTPITSMQVKLFETTNFIEFHYQNYGAYIGSYGGVGLNGTLTPSFVSYQYSNGNYTPNSNIRFTTPLPPNVQQSTSPKSINFGSQLTGVATYANVTVTHVGTQNTLILNAPSFGGIAASDYTVSSGPTPPGPLAIGQSATYTVQFIPSFGGSRPATFFVNTNGRDSGSQGVLLTGIGIAPHILVTPTQLFKGKKIVVNDTLEQTIVISSIGAASLYFANYPTGSFVFSGDNPGDYFVSRMPANPLPPGGTDTLKVKFVPKAEGGRPATLTINSNAENGAAIPVLLKGIGIIPRITIAPTYLDYDSTQITDTTCKQITIYNPGSDSLRIKNHYFASNDNDFSFTPLVGQQLVVAPNDSVKVTVCFAPLQKGTRQARFRVIGNIPMTIEYYPQDTSAVDVEIRGNATPLDKTIIVMKDFTDDIIIGDEAATTLELSNVGSDPVIVNAPIINGTNAKEFSITKVNFPATIAPGNSISMTVTAKPMVRGDRTANIAFNLTSEGRPFSVNTTTKAHALLACATSNTTVVVFEKLLLEETATKTVEVSNCGDIAQTFTASLSGSDAYSLDNSTLQIPVGEKAIFTLSFAPKAEGKAISSLVIKGSHINDMSVALSGTAEKKPDVTQSVGKVSEMDGFTLEQNAPNPAVGYTNFTFTSPKQSNIRFYLSDMSGKIVKEIANSSFAGGKHSVSMDTKELTSGSYVYILESGATRIMRQMVVTK